MKIITNPDENFVKEIREKIQQNQGYCACAISLSSDNKCMCKEFREQVERGEQGYCDCGLYAVINE